MSDAVSEIRVPLSVAQQRQVAGLRAAIAKAQADLNLIATVVIGGTYAPDAPVWAYHCVVEPDVIILTPKPS